MIYKLEEAFTKILETEGVLENKSVHSPVEVVMTSGEPERGTGIELQPKEKFSFSVTGSKCLYARCANPEHLGANLAVVDFNASAANHAGTNGNSHSFYGGFQKVILFEGNADEVGSYPLNDDIENYDFLYIDVLGDSKVLETKKECKIVGFCPSGTLKQAYQTNVEFDKKTMLVNYCVAGEWAKKGVLRVIGLRGKDTNGKTLWQGTAGSVSETAASDTVALSESLHQYTKFGVRFVAYNAEGLPCPQYREFYTSQLEGIINGKYKGGNISAVFGNADFINIMSNSTMQTLEIQSCKSVMEEIIGFY